jgi:hypothetical protein
VVHFPELLSDSLSNRSLLIHSRTYGGQFLICTCASHLARNMTASRSTKVRSFRSRTIRWLFDSALISLSNSGTLSASIRPLNLKTASPLADLVIRNIRPLVGILTSCNVRRYCNDSTKVNLFKTGYLIGVGFSSYENFRISKRSVVIRAGAFYDSLRAIF